MLECCSVNQAMFRSSRKILDGSFGLRSTFGHCDVPDIFDTGTISSSKFYTKKFSHNTCDVGWCLSFFWHQKVLTQYLWCGLMWAGRFWAEFALSGFCPGSGLDSWYTCACICIFVYFGIFICIRLSLFCWLFDRVQTRLVVVSVDIWISTHYPDNGETGYNNQIALW